MVSKRFLTTAILGAVALLIVADANSFAGGRGGGGGGRGGGGGYGHGGYGGGYGYGRGGYGYGGFYGGFYGGGLFYGDYLLGGGYPGYYAPYAYPAPTYYNADPYYPQRISAIPSTAPSITYYAGPSGTVVPAGPTAKSASIHVVLPDPQATVLFDGRPTTSTGSDRSYHTPDLAPGRSHQYKLRVTWMHDGNQVSQERIVSVTPGQTTDVVFSRLSSENVPTVSVLK